MILTSKILDKLLNSEYFLLNLPMVDFIETEVIWDGDEEMPFYKIHIRFYLKYSDITYENMFEKDFDPHYIVDKYIIDILKMVNVSSFNLSNIYISAYDVKGRIFYPNNYQ